MTEKPMGVAARISAALAAAPNHTLHQDELVVAAGLRDRTHLLRNVQHMIAANKVSRGGTPGDRTYTLLRSPDTRPVVARSGVPFRILQFIYEGRDRRRSGAEMRAFKTRTNAYLFGVALRNLRRQEMLDVGVGDVGLTQRGRDAMDRVVDLSVIEASSVDDGSLAQLLDGDDIEHAMEQRINANAEQRWSELLGELRYENARVQAMPFVRVLPPGRPLP